MKLVFNYPRKFVDMIIVVDKGNVVEYGTHDELMAKMSLYYSLYMQQEV